MYGRNPDEPKFAANVAKSSTSVATPLVPRYSEMQSYVFERMGWTPSDFAGIRLQLKYPPLGSTVILRFELPERPLTGRSPRATKSSGMTGAMPPGGRKRVPLCAARVGAPPCAAVPALSQFRS